MLLTLNLYAWTFCGQLHKEAILLIHFMCIFLPCISLSFQVGYTSMYDIVLFPHASECAAGR